MSDLYQKTSETINAKRQDIAQMVVTRQFERQPEYEKRYGAYGRQKCLEDANYHLSYLSEAIGVENPVLFADYVGWAKILLAGYNISAEDLALNLNLIQEVLLFTLPPEMSTITGDYIDIGLKELPVLPVDIPTYLDHPLAKEYLDLLLAGDRHGAARLVLDAASSGVDPRHIYVDIFQKVQYEVGRLWQMNKISVAQEHYCTAATQMVMSQMYPYIFSQRKRKGYRFVGASIGGDLHEIGIRIIADFLEMSGWDTFYLGANTPTPSIIKTLIERKADVLGVSATMTYHLSKVTDLIQAIRNHPECQHIKIMVGGRPFNIAPDLWKRVGADATVSKLEEVVATAESLMDNK